MTYVYIRSEPGLWTVGFYKPDGKWEPESDHDSRDDASRRVARLNGGTASDADTYSLAEVRSGTGWPRGRFMLVDDA